MNLKGRKFVNFWFHSEVKTWYNFFVQFHFFFKYIKFQENKTKILFIFCNKCLLSYWSTSNYLCPQNQLTQVYCYKSILTLSLPIFWHIVCSHGTVFPSNWLELSPSLEYISRDLSISPRLKLLFLTLFSEVFTLYFSVFVSKMQITECFK